jgi:hypothetical protein
MTASVETLERLLIEDLERLGDRLADDRLCTDLYRALTNRSLSKRAPGVEGHLALSWSRVEEIVNAVRAAHAQPPLAGLAQSGGEGEVSDRAGATLADLGWDVDPVSTSERDDRHVGRPTSPPPAGQGEARSPAADSHAWEREAHEQADRSRHRPPKL